MEELARLSSRTRERPDSSDVDLPDLVPRARIRRARAGPILIRDRHTDVRRIGHAVGRS